MAAIFVDKSRISGTDISFSLIPKLNAAGRMGRVRVAFDLLNEVISPDVVDPWNGSSIQKKHPLKLR